MYFEFSSPIAAAAVRLKVSGAQADIDELEAYGAITLSPSSTSESTQTLVTARDKGYLPFGSSSMNEHCTDTTRDEGLRGEREDGGGATRVPVKSAFFATTDVR